MRELIRNSIVFRSASAVLGVSFFIGILFSVASYIYFVDEEQDQTVNTVYDLLASLENTASIACYINDQNLANEVVNGLGRNADISQVSINVKETILAKLVKPTPPHHPSIATLFRKHINHIDRDISSPFNSSEKVCTVHMEINQDAVFEHSTSKARFVVALLLFQTVLIALVLVYIMYRMVTNPIKSISDRLHTLLPQNGELLPHPHRYTGDELGQLVNDVNNIISDLVSSLDEERHLRVQHALGEKKFQAIFDNAETGIFQMNEHGELISYNQALARMLDLPTGQTIASHALLERISGQELRLHLMIHSAISEAQILSEDFYIELGQNKKKWLNIVVHAAENGVLQGLINDVTERKQQEEKAHQLAVTDHLTGLNNRLGLDREMARLAKENANGTGCPFFLLLIDLDKFKTVNDTYGHSAGDIVLVHFAKILLRTLRKTDFIARLGGDEFVLLLRGLDDLSKAEEIARKIISQASRRIDISPDTQVQIGTSIGISYTPASVFSPEDLLAQADAAMYEVKQHGRNAYQVAPYFPDDSAR
ncbi:diguanylate cyclase domain-containing protein [Undibacterium oligocarboniphilum]|uniref:Diguanylate cyclase n=1 Tax=Undibacterium oligocarboniphilum TaxID=666702 RepID=A0A850QFU2_9BURK|nr:diguanylate cyclase [Undibacterium oligocarboniphilum]MBC3870068.1 diguanylate cyclase [Undibacterium oligocarboniphilum]NVO78059.1 diguanylate cyclase [Undibacterium oligocarboniphilum]